ncbi:MAG: hypothetical protein E6H63_19595 [Betaproteobacteria bacterium]|nr:MAG: hypothetical protein E6H63_19595 [Betaproteobacteria bacterium]
MNTMASAFKTDRARAWTRERLDQLSRQELVNLQANAQRLGEQELAALCAALLEERPRKLMPRTRAFEARGVWLYDPRTSWSGVRKADGAVVMALWQPAVKSRDGGCRCLLWAPNVGGARPWSDSPAGRERLEHCKLAIERQGAEGLLVYGQPLEGRLPEDRASTVLGIDAETVIRFQVELRGAEYWACWGKKTI